jgi:prepilin-type N-terminal cleavage/methylation domain-containing protein
MQKISRNAYGFTLIELFTVMAVVAIIFGIAYPVFISIMERARKTQAKNDLTQIVTAVNAYYTEYGKYPLAPNDNTISNNADLFYSLRAIALGANSLVNGVPAINPRSIVFIQPHDSKVSNPARAGIDSATGAWYDPWGSQYRIAIDGNYNNNIDPNPYTANTGAGTSPLNIGVISWSAGKDGKAPDNGGTQTFSDSDDVISWQ